MRTIAVPLYGASVRLVVGRDLPAAYQLARVRAPRLAEVHGDDEAGVCVVVDGVPWVLVPADVTPGQLAHELLHASLAVLRDRGVSVADSNEEGVAYLLGHLVDVAAPWLARTAPTLK